MKFRCYQCAKVFEAEPKHGDHAYAITCAHCGWSKQAYKFDQVHEEDDLASIVGTRLDELLKAEERVWELESLITSLKKGIGTGWMSMDDVREVLEQ